MLINITYVMLIMQDHDIHKFSYIIIILAVKNIIHTKNSVSV